MEKIFAVFAACVSIGLSLTVVGAASLEAAGRNPGPAAGNPLIEPFETPFRVPPFHLIKNEHFLPAIREGIRRHAEEIQSIVENPASPSFADTIEALDRSGIFLSEVTSVFGVLQGADTNPELQDLARQTEPLLAAHRDDINLNARLFRRVKAVYEARAGLDLNQEELYLLENTYKNFVRSGALLDDDSKGRLREINKELSLLSLRFGENLLAETNDFKLVIEDRARLAGLPPSLISMAGEAAKQAGHDGKWIFTLQAPSWIPFLQYSENRALRETVQRAYVMRGDRDNGHDNKDGIRKIVALRGERARLLGYASHAHFVLENNMARNPETVNAFLKKLWDPALGRAKAEAAELQALMDEQGGGVPLAPWDWWYYAEKLRQKKYALDDSALRPYFKLDNVRGGIFLLCERLYGLKFIELPDLPRYNPEVQVFEVRESDGRHTGILYMDFHPRAGKRGGAWSGGLRRSYYADGRRVPPVATIVCNFTRPAGDTPSLLSLDEVETFFHEFGHALATLLSESRFRSRSIARDSVELPSQIMEHWVTEPEMLSVYAKHYRTGEVIPADLVEKIGQSRLFNQGFATVEYLAAAILDMAWHTESRSAGMDVRAFEKDVLAGIGLIPEIVSRYRSTYFSHIFNGGYAAGYYNYIWSEILDSDAFELFKEKGIFDKASALSFRNNILEKFGTEDIAVQYRRFRGADPAIEPLLAKRGLAPTK
ncbi:MAG: M3 family metallopeptidase [Acidobacteriota bacterium]|nr:M3 family metallopeptidase [Acidobacteriota bacterium]